MHGRLAQSLEPAGLKELDIKNLEPKLAKARRIFVVLPAQECDQACRRPALAGVSNLKNWQWRRNPVFTNKDHAGTYNMGQTRWSEHNTYCGRATGKWHRAAAIPSSRDFPGARGCMEAYPNDAVSLLLSDDRL